MTNFAIITIDEADRAAFELKRARPRDPEDPRSTAFKNVSDALYALTNDTDFIVTDEAVVPKSASTRHFFCHATDDNGDSLDWFVEAYSIEQAEELWDEAVKAAGMEFGAEPARIWELPHLTGQPNFINWHNDTPEDGHPYLVPLVGADPET